MAQTEIQSAYIALLLDCRFDMDVCMKHVVVQEMLHIALPAYTTYHYIQALALHHEAYCELHHEAQCGACCTSMLWHTLVVQECSLGISTLLQAQ